VYLAPSVSPKDSNGEHDENLDHPYILYVGDVNWNKNIPGLLRAFSQSLKKMPNCNLILVGKAFCDDSIAEVREIKSLINSLDIGSHVKMPGYVNASSLNDLYTHALCLVQPSFYEGFGFPVVDALSLGCPVISSNTSSLSEISGPSLQTDPNNPEHIAGCIIEMFRMSGSKKKKMISDGLEWVSQFTWKRVAKETIESYTKALS
jgi:glycosyltransferase involved in cell wall biosynthesis